MDQNAMKQRTKQFSLRTINLVKALPRDLAGRIVGEQLLRSGLSVGANYRAACRARSQAEFIAKLGVVEEEADESEFWMELIIDDEMIAKQRVEPLMKEAHEIVAMMATSIMTAKRNQEKKR